MLYKYFTYTKKLMESQLSLPHEIKKKKRKKRKLK